MLILHKSCCLKGFLLKLFSGIKYQETVAEIMGPGSPPRNIRPYPYPNGFKVTWEPPEYPNGKIDVKNSKAFALFK